MPSKKPDSKVGPNPKFKQFPPKHLFVSAEPENYRPKRGSRKPGFLVSVVAAGVDGVAGRVAAFAACGSAAGGVT